MTYEHKVVLVTGAGTNTGLAIAEAFAKAGATVVLNDLNSEDVEREAKRIREAFGTRVIEAVADVSKQDQVDAMFVRIEQECGRLDVLVNNAVHLGLGHSFVGTPREFLEKVFQVNVFGCFACAQGAARMMQRQGNGSIIHISSNTAQRAILNRTVYISSKAAIDGLNRSMALELGPDGIRVNCIVPGYIHTPRWDDLPEGHAERRRANLPLGMEATGKDISGAVLFLASDAAAKITGTEIVVDAGQSSQLSPPDCDV